jgi:ABC-type nitrate/sulfonate/bicarbonate transport system substrate-binding protein
MLSDWTRCLPDYYTPVIVTSEKTIAQRPDLIKRFMAATAKGYQFAIDNPSEAADILIKAVPEMKAELVRKSQAWLSPRYKADAPRWGEQKLEVWRAYGDWMADRGLISKKIDASKAFTNAFLP